MEARPTVVLATRNAGKAREFGRLLEEVFVVAPLPDHVEMPEETGSTFRENAALKAQAAFAALGGGTAVLADDSGLEVLALGGIPGVQSARYAGELATDEENVAKLLAALEDVPDRSARFVCCLCLLQPAGTSRAAPMRIEVRGEAPGFVEVAPRGADGFGYDPVFRPRGWTETLAEASPSMKDEVSHRGAAARALVASLKERQASAEEVDHGS